MPAGSPNLPGVGPRLRVCLLVDTVGIDAGTERLVAETARRLDAARFEVHVGCLEASPQLEELRSCCQTAVFPVVGVNSWNGMTQVRAMRRYLLQHEIQVVHAFMNKAGVLAVLSSLTSGRVVITSRLNTGYWYTPTWQRYMRLLNLATTRVLTNSEIGRRITAAAEHLDPNKIDVLYQGVNCERFRPGAGDPLACVRLGIPPEARLIGIVANLRPVKDISLFLRAAKLVAQRVPDAAFLIVGHGQQFAELQTLAEDLGLADRVFFTRGAGNVVDYLSRMSIACLSSESEGFSNAILEYMAVGLPVVATDVGGNGEAVIDGETGYLVRERTPEAFAQPLVQLLENEDLRRRIGGNGLRRCLSNFEIGKTIRDLEDYYAALVRSAH